MAYLEYFSPQRLALQQEIANHPELWPHIAKHPADDFTLRLAAVAAYCEIIVDGIYSEAEIDNLCDICTRKLMEKRTLILLGSDSYTTIQ